MSFLSAPDRKRFIPRRNRAEAIELGVPAFVITSSLFTRFSSQDSDSFSDKLLAAMRNQFGGHAMKSE